MSAPVSVGHFVSGHFQPLSGTASVQSVNPWNPEETLADVAIGSTADVDQAVQAATSAFSGWCGRTASARADALFAWADKVQARSDELATAIAREVGKPLGEAKGEIGRTVSLLRYYAGEAVRPSGEVVPALTSSSLQYAIRVPLGVVGLITPWNFPFAIPIWKAAPALAMGNTVVLKPSELSALCGQLLAETAYDLPAGVLNVVQGDGSTGAALVEHAGVRAISFTGSVAVGKTIQGQCAARNAKVQCEMGGKNAAVVLKDADLPRAANLVAGGAMRFAGQKCTATSRVIVEASVYDAFLAELIKAVDALPTGSPLDAATAIGPVIDERAHTRLASILATAGERIHASSAQHPGFWVPPTIIGPVEVSADVAQNELFGPVLAVIKAQDLDHAIQLANSTDFGLSTAVYTRDIAAAMSYVDRIEAGLVRVNGDTTGVDLHAPFGGMKASSSGTREQGTVAKDFYTEWKTVQINP